MIKEDLQKLSDELKSNVIDLIKEYETKTGISVISVFVMHDTGKKDVDVNISFYFKPQNE